MKKLVKFLADALAIIIVLGVLPFGVIWLAVCGVGAIMGYGDATMYLTISESVWVVMITYVVLKLYYKILLFDKNDKK